MNEKPLRIGFCVHKMQVAGAEVLIDRMLKYFGEGIEPTIFCLDAIGSIGERMRQEGRDIVVLDRRPGIDWSIPGRYAHEIESRRIEVLHAHQYTPFFYSALAKRRCRTARPKLYFTEHGRHYPDLVNWKRKIANKFFFARYADSIGACSQFSADAVVKVDGFPKCDVILNGVPIETFRLQGDAQERQQIRKRLGIPEDRPLVACVARFHPVKDHATLLRAWVLVAAQHPDAVLLLLGEGSERVQLEEQIQRDGIESSVRFMGARSDVQDFLRCVDVFALTSLSEASPLTLLEAMACGCPAVVTDVGGNAEHVTHGVEAMLAGRGEHVQIASHLNRLLADPQMRQAMGAAGRRRIEAQFTIERCLEQYGREYARLAGRPIPGMKS
jgi:glycosyltransferase involved in cell wall biosynthesis